MKRLIFGCGKRKDKLLEEFVEGLLLYALGILGPAIFFFAVTYHFSLFAPKLVKAAIKAELHDHEQPPK